MDLAADILQFILRQRAGIVVDKQTGNIRQWLAGLFLVKLECANYGIRHAGIRLQLVLHGGAMCPQVDTVRKIDRWGAQHWRFGRRILEKAAIQAVL